MRALPAVAAIEDHTLFPITPGKANRQSAPRVVVHLLVSIRRHESVQVDGDVAYLE
ncbi:MAG TPA: hypothetical protein VFL96_16450 [Acidobacteriaceae bacterium]|nr:hypothetical protein [Acidobacteriaceae bacterium]